MFDGLAVGNTSGTTIAFFIFLFIFMVLIYLDNKGWVRENILHRKRNSKDRDPQRVYTRDIKKSFSEVCHNRCEGGFFIFRCHNHGNLQGDHWYPHANGGATTSKNLVMLCRKCNSRKSNKIPTLSQSFFLGLRRKIHPDYELRLPFSVGQYYPRWDSEQRVINMRMKGNVTIEHINNNQSSEVSDISQISQKYKKI